MESKEEVIMESKEKVCRIFRPGEAYTGKQGFSYQEGVSAESAGATGLCMATAVIPPGTRGKAHLHENHESAIYVISGDGDLWYGDRLQHHLPLRPGDMLYIPAGMPHLAANFGDVPMNAIVARTDPNEQESVTLLPELEALVPSVSA
jgi:uncharacterized RmlC-like cupin family protein